MTSQAFAGDIETKIRSERVSALGWSRCDRPEADKKEAAFDRGLFNSKTFERVPPFYLDFWVRLSSLSIPIPGTDVLPMPKAWSFETCGFVVS